MPSVQQLCRLPREAGVKLDREASVGESLPRPREHGHVGINPYELGRRRGLSYTHKKRTRATANVDDYVARIRVELLDKSTPPSTLAR